MVLSLAACGNDAKTKAIGKKKCECEKLRKKARRSDSEKKEREYKQCKAELEAMEYDLALSNFDELWKEEKYGKDDLQDDLNNMMEDAYNEACDKDDDDDDE